MRRGQLVLACLTSLMSLMASPAAGRPRVALVEHRAGVTRAVDLAARMSAILERAAAVDVVSPAEAHRRLRGQLGAEIANCAGDPACVAKVGQQLQVDEVILVGISQLGDVIVALQRISVASRAVEGRIADALPPEVEPTDEVLLGYLKRLLPPENFRRFGAIRVRANVLGAEVLIDGLVRGVTPLAALKVDAPHRYRLKVRKPGYLDFTASLEVQPDGVVEVTPEIQRRPPTPAWYQRWWVWGLAGVVVAGTTTALIWSLRPAPSAQQVPVYLDPNRPVPALSLWYR
jgi:hypothetical protein